MEQIEITDGTPYAGSKWRPVQGDEIESLIKQKGFTDEFGTINDAGDKIIDETYRIMEMCGNPKSHIYRETGLVLGYVQSGKTLSFTSLAALANDNGYQIIVLIAGTSKPLSEQSYERIKKDLRADGSRNDRKWTIIKNPDDADRDTIEIKLEQWKDETFPKEDCSTLMLTVMKNGSRLRNVTRMLKGIDLNDVPTLIIDDESDQASMNTKASANASGEKPVNEGEVSVIYNRINELRNVFSHHTFLQYTATPQANLFVNIMDRLSPNFIKLLTPGDGYTGGFAFFIENPSLIRAIPTDEIPTKENVLDGPPNSLLLALKIFYLGVVAGEIKKDQRNRSMMVHPSRLTGSQSEYCDWVKNVSESWRRLLLSNDEEEKSVLLQDFKSAFDDLKATAGEELPPFAELTGNRLIHAIRNTRIIELNSRLKGTPTVRWSEFYSHILVGGQAMDRGFTVEGLTVTYMPRNLGTGQVDTTLQRARFFGYKGKYLGFCRVWLDHATITAYQEIVKHEEDVRNRLQEFDVNNRHLNDWERETVLDQMLRLTRPNIIYDELTRDFFGREWFWIKAPHDTLSLISHNNAIIENFVANHKSNFSPDNGNENRTPDQRHLVAQIDLADSLANLLNRLKFTRESDSQTFSSLRGLISNYLSTGNAGNTSIYLMSSRFSGDQIDQTTRGRRLENDEKNIIQQLFQGKNPKSGVPIYPGDREIRDLDKVSIQIHRLNITDSNGNEIKDENGNKIFDDVYTIAVWVPQNIGKDIIRQPDNI